MKTEENDIEQIPRVEQRRSTSRPESTAVPRADQGDDEIDLVDLIRQFWARRRIIWITTGVVFFIGLLIALLSPEEYEASVVLMPQSSEGSSRSGSNLLRQFGGLAGLGLGSAGGDGTLNPTLYPEITQSTPFFLDLIEEEAYFVTLDTTLTFAEYFGTMDQPGVLDHLKNYTIGLPRLIINLPVRLINAVASDPVPPIPPTAVLPDTSVQDSVPLRESTPLRLSGQQRGVISKVKDRITTTIEENSTVEISAKMPDPVVAAHATEVAAEYLTNYILEYRTEKAQLDLAFVEKQYAEKQERYNRSQQRLARFRDRNTNIISEIALIEQERLESENQLALSLYESMAQQLAQAQIKVQEETPVFKVLEPIQIPARPSEPNRELIIILSIFVGLFLGAGIVFFLILYHNFKNSLTSSS